MTGGLWRTRRPRATLVAACAAPPPSMNPRPASSAPKAAADGSSRSSLAAFHQALASLEAGRTQRVNIVQIGDSHTEAEHFSGRLRALFQARFGNAGRGMLAPGAPVDYWRPYQVRAQQAGKWQVFSATSRTTLPCRSDCPASSCARQPHRHHDAGGWRR